MKRVSLIGAGRIGKPVLEFLRGSNDWTLVSVLVRTDSTTGDAAATTDDDAFFSIDTDLIIDTAGPDALRCHGERALKHADLWTIGGSALRDSGLKRRLQSVGERSGHRLRILPGAIGGLDAISALACDPLITLNVDVERPGLVGGPGVVFDGSVREGAGRFGDSLNVAAASSLAGPGFDCAHVTLRNLPKNEPHRLSLQAKSRYGRFTASFEVPTKALASGSHPVAASIIAALVRESQIIWVG